MKKGLPRRGFTLIEILIVMAVMAILIRVAIPSFRGMKAEVNKAKAENEMRVLKVAVEAYQKNNNTFPSTGATWQSALTGMTPRILDAALCDPFGATSTTQYSYDLSPNSLNYVIYSAGLQGSGIASVDNGGTITATNDAIWTSGGRF